MTTLFAVQRSMATEPPPRRAECDALTYAAENGHYAVVQLLLADPRVDASADGNSALKCAACEGRLAILDRLLADPRVDAACDDLEALRGAAKGGRSRVVDRLLAEPAVEIAVRTLDCPTAGCILRLLSSDMSHKALPVALLHAAVGGREDAGAKEALTLPTVQL